MEQIHQILIESVSGGFFKFCGYWLIIALVVNIPVRIVAGIARHYTLGKNGYPPAHCDVDGGFRKEKINLEL